MQRIIVFLGLMFMAGSLAVGAHWPAANGPTIPRPDLAATSSPTPSPSPGDAQTQLKNRLAPTPLPSATPQATPSPTPTPTPSPSPSVSPSPSPSPSISPKPVCGGCGANPRMGMMCPMVCVYNHN